jgi:hypothetical protein
MTEDQRAERQEARPADPRLLPGHCHKCGCKRVDNPHPDAGKPGRYLEVGCEKECLPCMVLSRHQWYQRAMKSENELKDLKAQAENSVSEDVIEHCWKMYQQGQISADHTAKEVFVEVLESFAKWSKEQDMPAQKTLAEQQPVATLHDDGHYVWKGAKPHDFNYAGWRMEVYAVPQTAKREPLAWINPYALKCLQGNATAVCAPKGMREEDETIPLYSGPQSTNDVLNVADHALLAAGYVEAYEIILAFQPILRATTSGAGTPARSK